MTAQITLPRDAAGREIPLDTKVLYDKDNKEHRVLNYIFNTDTGNWIADFETEITLELHATEGFSLMPPDSWEKLEEDLDRCIEADCVSLNVSLVLEDIKRRIRKLRGED